MQLNNINKWYKKRFYYKPHKANLRLIKIYRIIQILKKSSLRQTQLSLLLINLSKLNTDQFCPSLSNLILFSRMTQISTMQHQTAQILSGLKVSHINLLLQKLLGILNMFKVELHISRHYGLNDELSNLDSFLRLDIL